MAGACPSRIPPTVAAADFPRKARRESVWSMEFFIEDKGAVGLKKSDGITMAGGVKTEIPAAPFFPDQQQSGARHHS
jgi:hypothetical protein